MPIWLIQPPLPDNKFYDYEVLDSENVLVAHRLLAQSLEGQTITPALLNTLPVVSYDSQLPLIRQYFDTVFKQSCTSKIIARCPALRALAGIVRTGVGYTVLPDYLCHDDIQSGRLIKLAHKALKTIYIWRGVRAL
ncbi:LysR substrate-binding domain-containing protein (plasmid) [Pseudoalteromonas espejiana]